MLFFEGLGSEIRELGAGGSGAGRVSAELGGQGLFSGSPSSASLRGGTSVTGCPGHMACTEHVSLVHCCPELPGKGHGGGGGEPRGHSGVTASASPEGAVEKAGGPRCLGLRRAGDVRLLVDSELTRKSCLVFLCFLRVSLKHLNPLSDLSVTRPTKPCFLLPPWPPCSLLPTRSRGGGIL